MMCLLDLALGSLYSFGPERGQTGEHPVVSLLSWQLLYRTYIKQESLFLLVILFFSWKHIHMLVSELKNTPFRLLLNFLNKKLQYKKMKNTVLQDQNMSCTVHEIKPKLI